MKKFLSFMKPYIMMIVISISLLFVQVYTDLKLPNYMSQIVDTGIQQSGIEHASPDKLGQTSMRFMKAVFPEEQYQEFANNYQLEGDYFVLKDDADRNLLDRKVGESMWTFINLMGGVENMESSGGEMSGLESIEDLLPVIVYLETVDNTAKNEAYEEALKTEEKMLLQSGNILGQVMYKDAGYDLQVMQRNYILISGSKMMGMTLVGAIATILVVFLSSKLGAGFSRDLRRGVFEKVQSFSSQEFDDFSSASLVVRTTNDITQIQNLLTFGLRMIVSAPIMAVGGVLMIQNHNTDLTWIVAVTVGVLLVLFIGIFALVTPKFKKQQTLVDDLNRVIRENLNGLLVIRAFDNKKFEEDRFEEANSNHADTILFISRVMVLMMPLLMLIMNVTILAILWFGAQRVSTGALQIGDMMAFIQYSMQIISSFLMIAMMFVFIPRALVSIRRILEVLNREPSIVDTEKPQDFIIEDKGMVEFKDVSFKYAEASTPVLENISFKAERGKTTAFIGSTGSGKSTLVKLILRFFDVTEGAIEVNGVDIRDVSQKDLRDNIGYVPQKSMLLSGDVKSNVGYGRDEISEEEIKEALEIAQAQFVLTDPEGLEMHISQDATNVSGGQKQRLSIARALAKDAPILIFDDSFSALDFKTDLTLRTKLKEELGDSTFLIVAQRINTIMDADQIIVLDEGRIVGKGTHKELLKSCEAYHQIALSQLSEEELANE